MPLEQVANGETGLVVRGKINAGLTAIDANTTAIAAKADTSAVAAGYQPLDSDLTAIAALTTTTFGRSVLTQADAAALRTLGGLGTVATLAVDTDTTLAADSDTRVPSQKAVKAAIAAVSGGGTDSIRTRFKRAISARGNRRHEARPWRAPPAHAASTLYRTGQRVVAGGNIYLCDVGGTSGAASTPSGTSLAQITDGGVTWLYMGPTFADDAGAPTFSTSTTASALGRFYRNASCGFASGAATVISNDGWYNFSGVIGAPGGNGFAEWVSSPVARLEFGVDRETTSVCVVHNNANGNYGPVIEVDGRYLIDSVIPQAGTGGQTYTTINFSDNQPHTVVVRWPCSTTSTSVVGVYCNASGSVFRPASKPGAVRAVFVGDSFAANTNNGDHLDRGIAATMLGLLGVDDVFISGEGGTGFVAGGGGAYTDARRIGYITTYAPNVVVAMGSVNDGGASQAAMSAAINAWVASIRGALGADALIVITGLLSRGTAEHVVEGYMRIAIAALVTAGDSNLLFLPATGDSGGPWVTGTGYAAGLTGIGKGDSWFGWDNLHPTTRGTEGLGRQAARALADKLSA